MLYFHRMALQVWAVADPRTFAMVACIAFNTFLLHIDDNVIMPICRILAYMLRLCIL